MTVCAVGFVWKEGRGLSLELIAFESFTAWLRELPGEVVSLDPAVTTFSAVTAISVLGNRRALRAWSN